MSEGQMRGQPPKSTQTPPQNRHSQPERLGIQPLFYYTNQLTIIFVFLLNKIICLVIYSYFNFYTNSYITMLEFLSNGSKKLFSRNLTISRMTVLG